MTTCYLCDAPFTDENRSREHILLNSIGGHLKSRDLLCRICNSKFGHDADAELAKQLSFLSSYVQVKRDSGSNPIIKGLLAKNGKEYHIIDGSKPSLAKPSFDEKKEGEETKYSITARNEKELLSIMEGLRKKHPEIDLEIAKQQFQWKEEYLDEPLKHEINIGGDLAFKSLVKSAVNYYVYTRRETNQVKHLFEYLKGAKELKIAKHFYPTKPIYKKDKNEIIHLIHLVGNKYERILYCFIELFSSYNFIILLSNNFTDKNFTSTYCYDILKNTEVIKEVKLKLKKESIEDIYKMTLNDFETITAKLKRFMRIVNEIQTKNEIRNITRKSVAHVFDKHKNEKIITQEMINDFTNETAIRFTKFMMRGRNRNDDWKE